MKIRPITFFVVLTLILSTSFAQKAKKTEVGIYAGFGTPWIINQMNYGLPEMEYDYFWGYGFCFESGYNFNDNVGIFAEFGYHRHGQRYYDNWRKYDKTEVQRKISMNYLDLPILVKYTYGETKARFRLLFGPMFSFLQSAEQVYTFGGQSMEGMFTFYNKSGDPYDPAATDIKDRFTQIDVALLIDLGADIWMTEGVWYLSASARYWFSMKDLNIDAYRIENPDGIYQPSHISGVFVTAGIHYIIGGSLVAESR